MMVPNGCEFLYDESYGKVPPAPGLIVYRIPIAVALWLANPTRLNECRQEHAYLALLAEDIAVHGILVPLEVIADPTPSCRLQEGHHRVLTAERLKMGHVPVRIAAQRTRAMKGHRRQLPPGGDVYAWFRLMEQL